MEENEIIKYLKEIKAKIEDHDANLTVIKKVLMKTNEAIPEIKKKVDCLTENVKETGENVMSNKKHILNLEERMNNLEKNKKSHDIGEKKSYTDVMSYKGSETSLTIDVDHNQRLT